MPPADWPDMEALLLARIVPRVATELLPEDAEMLSASTDLPAALAGSWHLRVRVISGSNNSVTERSRVDVDAFAPTREMAYDLSSITRDILEGLAATAEPDGSGLIDAVSTTQRPVWVDYANPDIQCFQTSHIVSVRQQ